MSKHEIEVEGLPEGWEPVAHRIPQSGENYFEWGEIVYCIKSMPTPRLIVKKKQPRRIVLEETDFRNIPDSVDQSMWHSIGNKWWREVKETEETKLCLSVEECEEILDKVALKNPLSDKTACKLIHFLVSIKHNNKTS